jgi:hypothetical protein
MPCLLNNHRVEALGFFKFIFEKFARVGDGAFHLLVGSPFAQCLLQLVGPVTQFMRLDSAVHLHRVCARSRTEPLCTGDPTIMSHGAAYIRRRLYTAPVYTEPLTY